jgi:hypothetical protein
MLFKGLDLLFGLLLADDISLLNLGGKFVPLASDRVQVLIRQFAPLRDHLWLVHLPIAFNLFPFHVGTPWLLLEHWSPK